MKKILIFTYLQRHFKKMIPIIKEFEKDKNIDLSVFVLTKDEKTTANEYNIKYKVLDEFTDKKRVVDFDLSWALEPLINAIEQIQPDLFMAIEVNYILRNAVRYCKQKNIPTVIVQHGTPNRYSLHAFAPFEGNIFAAWGQFSKDFLVENGVDGKKIILTGGVPFDRTLSLNPDKNKIAKELKIDPNKKWIVFTTQGLGPGGMPTEEEIKVGISEICREAMKYPEIQLIFQVHPSQDLDHVKLILNNIEGNNSIVIKYKDTEELMAASYGVITFFSTTALDAVIMKKPLMLINLGDDKDFLPFVNMQAAFGAYSEDHISSIFQEFLTNSKDEADLKKAAEYVNFKNDGKALQRVMDLSYKKILNK